VSGANALNQLAEVLARPDVWRGNCLPGISLAVLPSGFAALDAELPGGGWPRGALTELLVDGAGLGEISLLLPALRALCGNGGKGDEGGWSLLVAPPHPPHAPAWAAAGVDLARLMVVAPAAGKRAAGDALWAMEQALASAAPRAVLGWSVSADARAVRRLQVVAGGSGALAFLLRPLHAAAESSAAPLRLRLSAAPQGRLGVQLIKRRGPPLAQPLWLALPRPKTFDWRDHGTGTTLAGPPSAATAARSPSRPALA
jgi:hypothetical protein